MRVKKFLSLALCIILGLTVSSFAESKNKISDPIPELQYIAEEPISQEVIDNYLKNGGVLHKEVSYQQPTGEITAQWGTQGGSGGTHQKIANWGYSILQNDKGTSLYNKLKELIWDPNLGAYYEASQYFLNNAYLADDLENDYNLGAPYVGHFYGAGISAWGVNYVGNTSPTAYTRYNNHYYNAVTEYRNGNKKVGYKELGLAIHYLADLNNPFHAANRVVGASYHTQYESWVDSQVISDRWKVSSATSYGTYNYVCDNTFKKMSDDWASSANSVIDYCDNSNYSLSSSTVTGDCLGRAQRATAGLLYRFLRDTYRL